jgi:choline dehydrogenase
VDRGLREAALALGYPWNPDLNARTGEGVACYPINSRDGKRITTNDAFLEPARGRPNLEIIGGALVDRVLIENRRATGVRVRLPGTGWTEFHGREILLCAGAVHSPAILLRSGLGPAAALQGLGIEVVADHQWVGRNFMDHAVLRATLKLKPEHVSRDRDERHTNCCINYSSGLAGGGERDMIMIAFNHRALGVDGMPAETGAIGLGLYQAFSRGEVRLVSADPELDPEVDENMLDDARDRIRLRDAVRRAASLVVHPAIAGLADAITLSESGLTFPEVTALDADALDALMLEQAADGQHAAGTCKMTAYEDPAGVVDPDLRVKGIAGLRVADASIMPFDCRANTHFTCVMIGVMAAKRIAAG